MSDLYIDMLFFSKIDGIELLFSKKSPTSSGRNDHENSGPWVLDGEKGGILRGWSRYLLRSLGSYSKVVTSSRLLS